MLIISLLLLGLKVFWVRIVKVVILPIIVWAVIQFAVSLARILEVICLLYLVYLLDHQYTIGMMNPCV